MPERSKGFDSSSNVFVLVGSNPTECMLFIVIFEDFTNIAISLTLHQSIKLCYTFMSHRENIAHHYALHQYIYILSHIHFTFNHYEEIWSHNTIPLT